MGDIDDDFGAFTDAQRRYFGRLTDPFATIRKETEAALRERVPDTVLKSIRTSGKSKFLILGCKTGDSSQLRVTNYGFCFRAQLAVSANSPEQHVIDGTLTFMFGNTDEHGSETFQMYLDLHADAEPCFTDEVFGQRFRDFHPSVLLEPKERAMTLLKL